MPLCAASVLSHSDQRTPAFDVAKRAKQDANQQTFLEKLGGNQTITAANYNAILEKLDEIDKKLDELINSRLPRAFGSVSAGLHEAAAGGPVRSLVAASPSEVAAWLTHLGFAKYVPMLAPLGGAALMMQTPATLTRLGVMPGHVMPLMDSIIAERRPCD